MVIWKACRAGAWLHLRGRDPGGLGDAIVSCQAGAQPQGVGILARHGSDCPTQNWGPAEPEGWGLKGQRSWWGVDPVGPKRWGTLWGMDPVRV
jgi:hypothetical protein